MENKPTKPASKTSCINKTGEHTNNPTELVTVDCDVSVHAVYNNKKMRMVIGVPGYFVFIFLFLQKKYERNWKHCARLTGLQDSGIFSVHFRMQLVKILRCFCIS